MSYISLAGALLAYISHLHFKHTFWKDLPDTESQVESHSFLGRQQGQATGSRQENRNLCLLLAMPESVG